MQQIYILVNGEQQGPFTPDQIKGYLAMGHFHDNDLAWHEGLPEWKPLADFPEFAPRRHRTPNYAAVPIRKLAPQKTHHKGRNVFMTVLFLVVFGAVGAGGYYFWRQHQNKNADAAAAASASAAPDFTSGTAGIPKTPAELNGWYAEPAAGQNAATLFQQGFDALQIADTDRNSTSLPLLGKAPLPQPANPLSAMMKATLRSFLEKNQPALDLFARAAQCYGSRYPLDLTQGSDTRLPHLPKVKQAAQLAGLEALWQADSRNGTKAAEGVLVALAAARSLEPEPFLISQLVRVANQGLAADALEQAVNRVAMPPDSLNQLQSAFNHAADSEAAGTGFNRALVSERVVSLNNLDQAPDKMREAFTRIGPSSNNAVRETANDAADKALGNLKEQRQFLEDSLNQVLTARKDPLPGRLKADELMVGRANEAKSKQFALVAMMLPALGKVTSREAGSLARLRLAQTAVALERFRAANNRFPDSLNELAPKFLSAVPNDPFDGQPLRYRKAGEGYVLYSVGADLRDDGGVRKMGSDDLLFIVARPPKAS